MKTWTTKDGRVLLIESMTTDHIKNALAMLERKGFSSEDDFWLSVGAAASMQGEMASYYAEQSVAEMTVHPAIKSLEEELRRRGQ